MGVCTFSRTTGTTAKINHKVVVRMGLLLQGMLRLVRVLPILGFMKWVRIL